MSKALWENGAALNVRRILDEHGLLDDCDDDPAEDLCYEIVKAVAPVASKLTPGGYALAIKDAAGDTEFRLTALIALAQDIAPGPIGEASVAYFNEKAESRVAARAYPATEKNQPETPTTTLPKEA